MNELQINLVSRSIEQLTISEIRDIVHQCNIIIRDDDSSSEEHRKALNIKSFLYDFISPIIN